MAINEELGNEIPIPSFSERPYLDDDEILADTAGFNQIGVTLAGAQGILPAGTVLAHQASDDLFYAYHDGTGGDGTAQGVLRKRVDTTDGAIFGNMVTRGTLKEDKLSGDDAGAVADLNARVDTVLNTFTF